MLTKDNFNISNFENAFFDLFSKYKSDLPLEFIELFTDDNATHGTQNAMWSLLHTVESLPSDEYTKKVLVGLKLVAKNAPKWAELIAIRNLNSEEYRNQLAVSLKTAPQEDRVIWKSTIQNLISNEPDFENKAKNFFNFLN